MKALCKVVVLQAMSEKVKKAGVSVYAFYGFLNTKIFESADTSFPDNVLCTIFGSNRRALLNSRFQDKI